MSPEEMKRIKKLLIEATNRKDASLIENYIANEIIWHEGCVNQDAEDIAFYWNKSDFLMGNVLGAGAIPDRTKTIMRHWLFWIIY